jgi:hypothetical protein
MDLKGAPTPLLVRRMDHRGVQGRERGLTKLYSCCQAVELLPDLRCRISKGVDLRFADDDRLPVVSTLIATDWLSKLWTSKEVVRASLGFRILLLMILYGGLRMSTGFGPFLSSTAENETAARRIHVSDKCGPRSYWGV